MSKIEAGIFQRRREVMETITEWLFQLKAGTLKTYIKDDYDYHMAVAERAMQLAKTRRDPE